MTSGLVSDLVGNRRMVGGQLMEELAGTGEWQEDMRFRSGVDAADVQEWVNGLEL